MTAAGEPFGALLAPITLRTAGERIAERLVTAIALGERFYAERPRQFARRLSQYFSEWELTKTRCPATGDRPVALLN